MLRPSFYYSSAAAVLLAVISFLFVLSLPAPRDVAYVVPTGEAVRAGAVDAFTELTLPDRGAAYLREHTRFELRSRNSLALQSGEAFFAVHAGYVIETPHTTVTVEGTRFGVRVNEDATEVYVLEGRVRVGADRILDAGEGADRALWLADHVPPALALDARVLPGHLESRLEIALNNTGAAPALLGIPPDHGTLVAEVTGPDGRSFTLNLEMLYATFDPPADSSGRVVVDASRPLTISCPLRRDLFPGPGRYSIHVVYYSTPRHGWVGKQESAQVKSSLKLTAVEAYNTKLSVE